MTMVPSEVVYQTNHLQLSKSTLGSFTPCGPVLHYESILAPTTALLTGPIVSSQADLFPSFDAGSIATSTAVLAELTLLPPSWKMTVRFQLPFTFFLSCANWHLFPSHFRRDPRTTSDCQSRNLSGPIPRSLA